jgi:K(+)-stimulated pyrophosphate-energized sodium pump
MDGLPDLNIAAYGVFAGALIGSGVIEFIIAMLTDNTIDAAYKMAQEGEKELTPDVLAGKVKPDYERVIRMASELALKKMIRPSLVSLIIPVVCGLLFGAEFVGGVLIGATIVAIPRAIFMGNSGGAFDNAKKYIESGMLKGHGKGSAAHKAAVNGDTVGDTRKDVVGVALDIVIKLMSTMANTLSPIFRNYHLF